MARSFPHETDPDVLRGDRGILQHIVIVGAGIIGLASALLLAQDGFRVTIVAREMPGDGGTEWASPWAGANLIPPSEMGNAQMAEVSYRWYRALADEDPSSSVRTVQATEYFTDRDSDDCLWYKHYFPGYKRLPASELPPHCTLGVSYQTCIVNPDVFLPWIKNKLEFLGVIFIRAELKTLKEALSLISGAHVIVNASGLGSRGLASDETVIGYRGQTMFVKSDYKEVRMIQGSEYTYVIPRAFSGGVIIGGISQENETGTDVDLSLRHDILRRINRMTNDAFSHINLEQDVVRDIVGIRPGRQGGIRIARQGSVIHAYGFKGAGYIYSFGAAARVKQLVRSAFDQPRL